MDTHRRVIAITLLAAIGTACAGPASDAPELVLTGGAIYPLGADDRPVAALAIRGDSILALGSDAEVLQLADRYTQQMPLEDSAVLPGSYDAWNDLEALGRWPDGDLDMRLASTVEEAQAMVRNAAGAAGSGGWLLGWGWDENDWPEAALPNRSDLDAIGVERPIALLHRNGVAAWLNSAALAALPAGALDGYRGVVHDDAGEPTGILFGDALAVLDDVLAGTAEQEREWIAEGARRAAAAGVTRVATAPVEDAVVTRLLDLERRGLLPLRVDVRLTPAAATSYRGSDLQERVEDSTLVRVTAVGARVDGPLASHLALLSEPYATAGPALPAVDGAMLEAAAAAARDVELPLQVQASGDAAVSAALAAIAASGQPGGAIIGFDLLPADLPADLTGLRVAITPARFARDVYWLDRVLGPQRALRADAWADLAAAGVSFDIASDAPAYRLRPITDIATASTRSNSEGYPAGGWNTQQALGRDILLRALVGDGADLDVGAPADLVVWSEDPVAGDDGALRRAEALLTIVAGRVAYSRALVHPPMETDQKR
jgi:predicted amidohydrolase YtcJ